MILAHRIRLVPTPRQADYFLRACGTTRFVWNEALRRWKDAYEAGEKPSGRKLKKAFNADKYERWPWLREVHRDAHARPFDDLQAAFANFFRRVKTGAGKVGYPKFKKKGKAGDSFYVANDKLAFDGRRIRLPKVGWIKLREALRFDGKVVGATISRTADRWHVSVQVDVGERRKERTSDFTVGVDLGIKASATLSTGEVVEGPKALDRNIKKLRRLSRRHSRKEKGSRGRRKSAVRLARLHARIADVRSDWTHKLSTRLCRENQAVGIEDLHVAGMARNRKLARRIADEAWGQFRWQLTYKAPMFGTKLVVHDRWFPSSKRCSRCGVVRSDLPLAVRTFECVACGLRIDRDLNASRNLYPGVTGESTPVEIAALAEASVSVKLRSRKPESSGCSPERVAV